MEQATRQRIMTLSTWYLVPGASREHHPSSSWQYLVPWYQMSWGVARKVDRTSGAPGVARGSPYECHASRVHMYTKRQVAGFLVVHCILVAGTWYQVPGTRYKGPGTWYHTRLRVSEYQVPAYQGGTRYLVSDTNYSWKAGSARFMRTFSVSTHSQ